MNAKLAILALAATVTTTTMSAGPASARQYLPHDRDGYSAGGYDYAYPDRVYRRRDVRYDDQCRRSNGTTGLIAGGAGGALIGHAIGGDTLGTLLGALGGGLLGRHLDQRHDSEQNYRNGC